MSRIKTNLDAFNIGSMWQINCHNYIKLPGDISQNNFYLFVKINAKLFINWNKLNPAGQTDLPSLLVKLICLNEKVISCAIVATVLMPEN